MWPTDVSARRIELENSNRETEHAGRPKTALRRKTHRSTPRYTTRTTPALFSAGERMIVHDIGCRQWMQSPSVVVAIESTLYGRNRSRTSPQPRTTVTSAADRRSAGSTEVEKLLLIPPRSAFDRFGRYYAEIPVFVPGAVRSATCPRRFYSPSRPCNAASRIEQDTLAIRSPNSAAELVANEARVSAVASNALHSMHPNFESPTIVSLDFDDGKVFSKQVNHSELFYLYVSPRSRRSL